MLAGLGPGAAAAKALKPEKRKAAMLGEGAAVVRPAVAKATLAAFITIEVLVLGAMKRIIFLIFAFWSLNFLGG